MTLSKENQERLNKYLAMDIDKLTLSQLADFANLLDAHSDEVKARISPNFPEPKRREYPTFV